MVNNLISCLHFVKGVIRSASSYWFYTVLLLSSHRHKSHIQLRLDQKTVVEQSSLQIEMLSWHLDHIKCPQNLGYEQLSLHPSHFASDAGSWPKTERIKALQVVISKGCIVEWMIGGKPALRPIVEWIVVEARTTGERKDASLNMGLSDKY